MKSAQKNVNFVVFGHSHSGKSTLAGYITAKMERRDMDAFETRIKRKYPHYSEDQLYACLANEFKEEMPDIERNDVKTTNVHFLKNTLGNFTIIDTPGDGSYNEKRQLGMYYGDIGIFCVELSDLLNDTLDDNLMSSWLNWVSDSDERPVIVLLTKSDTTYGGVYGKQFCSEGEFVIAIEQAKYYFDGIDQQRILGILPISIDVLKRKDHNVFDRSEEMKWYTGKTLSEYLHEACSKYRSLLTNNSEFVDNDLLFSINKEIKLPESAQPTTYHRIGRIFNGKIFSGQMRKGDKVKICPVFVDGLTAVDATIKNIRYDVHKQALLKKEIDIAYKGYIISIDIGDYTHNKRKLEKDKFNLCDSTFVFSPTMKYKTCSKFTIAFKHGPLKNATDVRYELLWYGHALNLDIPNEQRDSMIVTAELLSDKQQLFIPDHVIKKEGVSVVIVKSVPHPRYNPNNKNQPKRLYEYYPANLTLDEVSNEK